MSGPNFRNRSVDPGRFSMIPATDVPRSRFDAEFAHKTTFDAGKLIPIYMDEVLPGDQHRINMTAFARMATPIYPVMDNLHMDTFFFFVPCRLVWDNWKRFMGEQDNPSSSTDYLTPVLGPLPDGFPVNSIFDYFGLPIEEDITNTPWTANIQAMPLRGYNLIWNEWFRDQNLQAPAEVPKGDGPDAVTNYELLYRGKRHDYFTSALPWPQKGDAVGLPLGQSAPVNFDGGLGGVVGIYDTQNTGIRAMTTTGSFAVAAATPATDGLYADLSEATAVTINQLRQAFQIQKLLERNARGGTRYTELVKAHFQVTSPDARLQRPEYLGGGSTPVNINPVAQQSATQIEGSTSPMGSLAGIGTAITRGQSISYSATEHGWIIGLVAVRADLTYQQGLPRVWQRRTKYDFYWPAFAHLGEQPVYRSEIFINGTEGDNHIFGYQERWAEYRYKPSRITGRFRSTSTGTLDAWHLAERFETPPVLSSEFILDPTAGPLERALAVGPEALGSQFIFDSVFNVRMARPMPMYSVPGLIDHF